MKFTNDNENNFIDLENKALVIRKHKNGKSTRFVKLKEQTINDIKYLRDMMNTEYLFIKKQGDNIVSMNGYDIEQMSRIAIKTYNKEHGIEHIKGKQGIHGIRQNKVTSVYNDLSVKMEEIKKIIELSGSLGHTISTQLRDYVKQV